MNKAPLSLHEARLYAALALAVALVAGTGLGIVAGALTGAVVAVLATAVELATIRVFVTCPATAH